MMILLEIDLEDTRKHSGEDMKIKKNRGNEKGGEEIRMGMENSNKKY